MTRFHMLARMADVNEEEAIQKMSLLEGAMMGKEDNLTPYWTIRWRLQLYEEDDSCFFQPFGFTKNIFQM